MHIKHTLIPALLLVVLFSSCRKEESLTNNINPTPTPVETTSEADKLKDSTIAYTRDIYLWADKIPASFNARNYAGPSEIMTAIRQYATETGFTGSVDRWSFAVNQQEWTNISNGVSADFGLNVFFHREGDLRVRAVEKASPAGKAGIRRGWRITSIAGNDDMTTANANYIVKNVYQSQSTTFTFQKPDGSTANLTLNAGTYQENPVVLDSVYTVSNRKIGYFVFSSFLGDTAEMADQFTRAFNRFGSAGIQDLVVDLRYNGGGYVSVAETLANYLAPSSANGNVMMVQKFNNRYSSYNSTDNFRKRGPLNLNRVFFIVSSGTASASELLINSLKPYMEVILVGPSKTHGKPVGYFPIPVGTNWYILPVSFFTVNRDGNGHYYNGMALNSQTDDGLDKDWGDLSEDAFGSAVRYITTGAFRLSIPGRTSGQPNPALVEGNQKLDITNFKGAIDTRGMR